VPVTIGSNIASLRAQRQLDRTTFAQDQATERLSSGLRINRSADDAAGLAVATSLNAKARVYAQAVRNIGDGISYLSIADGATQELATILDRVKELATQSANGAYSQVQRRSLDRELTALQAEYGRIINSTQFNGVSVFGSDTSQIVIQMGYGSSEALAVAVQGTLTTGDGTLRTAQTYPGGDMPRPTVADLNQDGILDLLATEGVNGSAPAQLRVFLGNGDGTFRSSSTFSVDSSSFNTTNWNDVGDFNGDGKNDVFMKTTQRFYTVLGNGDGTFQAAVSVESNPSFSPAGALRDLNGDGQLDQAYLGRPW
jgi:flagellin-like hook-associated protein FlgL